MATPWHVGDYIQDRWEIHHLLTHPLSVVYIVYDHLTRMPYAAKTLPEALYACAPVLADRVTQGVRPWLTLERHLNVTQAHFMDTIAGQPFLFLEYVSGDALSDWIGTPRLRNDLPQVLRFALQICDGMTHAISQGLTVHRDLKPQNCLITPDRVLKVTDMGLATVFDGLTVTPSDLPSPTVHNLSLGPGRVGTVGGTCPYMAPELFDDATQADVRADIYAFGVMLIQMLLGELPFVAQTWHEYAHLHRTAVPPALPTPYATLRTVVETCLAKEPARRFAGFHTLREPLAELYDRLTGVAAPQPFTGPELDAVQSGHLGAALNALGRPDVALTYCDRALELNPSLELAWAGKGAALEALEQAEEALACCDRALALNPLLDLAWFHKGLVLGATGQSEEAVSCFEQALALNPRLERAWLNMGVILETLGRTQDALACYNHTLTLNPRSDVAWFNVGNAMDDFGRPEDALACYERALACNPRAEMAWVNKGLTLGTLGKHEEALPCFDRALALNPRLAEAWFNKGVVLVNSFARHADALACFEEAQRLGATQAADGIALCRQALGQ